MNTINDRAIDIQINSGNNTYRTSLQFSPYLKGDKGDPFRFEDFTPELLESIRGPRGYKGDAFTYLDFTELQLEKLRGPKGNTGDVSNFVVLLKSDFDKLTYFIPNYFYYCYEEDLQEVYIDELGVLHIDGIKDGNDVMYFSGTIENSIFFPEGDTPGPTPPPTPTPEPSFEGNIFYLNGTIVGNLLSIEDGTITNNVLKV